MIQIVIFDIDGTLIDSVDLHARSWQETFERFGRRIPFADVRAQIGKGGDQLLPVFFSEEELERTGKEMEDYRKELFKQKYLPQVRPFPKTRELIERLQAEGKRIALASSAKKDELETYKKIARIDDLVHAETSSDDAERSKPHPDIFQAALRKLSNPPAESVMVIGDTPYDAQAAGKAGLRTIGVLCGGFPIEDLRAAGCVAIYQDPAELLARYEESPLAK